MSAFKYDEAILNEVLWVTHTAKEKGWMGDTLQSIIGGYATIRAAQIAAVPGAAPKPQQPDIDAY